MSSTADRKRLTRVVNVRRSAFDVIVDRTGIFGNPFRPTGATIEARLACIALFQAYFLDRLRTDAAFSRQVDALRGLVLGCHCAPLPCHGDVIAGYLNGELEVETSPPTSTTTA